MSAFFGWLIIAVIVSVVYVIRVVRWGVAVIFARVKEKALIWVFFGINPTYRWKGYQIAFGETALEKTKHHCLS